MNNRRVFYAILTLIIAVGIWYFGRPKPPEPVRSPIPTKAPPFPTQSPAAIANLPPDSIPRIAEGAGSAEDATFEGIDQLNASGKTINDDLRLLNDLFSSWQVTYPHGGNPVGSNAEITRAFTGVNKFHLAMIPKKHPAINAAGELVDRWGTPFFFHQLSGTRMEIRSAGPDRKLYTADDTVLSPEPVP